MKERSKIYAFNYQFIEKDHIIIKSFGLQTNQKECIDHFMHLKMDDKRCIIFLFTKVEQRKWQSLDCDYYFSKLLHEFSKK